MKIYDCFQFFDEEMLIDLRFNVLHKYVDKFVITEATYMHNGKPKKLNFDINKYSKFKDKITYQKFLNVYQNCFLKFFIIILIIMIIFMYF